MLERRTTALSPVSSGSTSTAGGGRSGGGGSSSSRGRAGSAEHSVDLRLDEVGGNSAVLGTVALMGVGVVAVAAVRIGGVAVRLDVRGVRALEASGARSELPERE